MSKVVEEITNEELNAALETLFAKVEEMGESVESLQNALDTTTVEAEAALNVAKAAKEAIKHIHAEPTNGWDTLNEAIKTAGEVALGLGLVGMFVLFMWLLIKADTDVKVVNTTEDEKAKIKIE